jgi:hypothetical protein
MKHLEFVCIKKKVHKATQSSNKATHNLIDRLIMRHREGAYLKGGNICKPTCSLHRFLFLLLFAFKRKDNYFPRNFQKFKVKF